MDKRPPPANYKIFRTGCSLTSDYVETCKEVSGRHINVALTRADSDALFVARGICFLLLKGLAPGKFIMENWSGEQR